MNWSLKKVGLILLVVCMAFGLGAEESIFIADGDIGALRLYDREGRPLDATLGIADEIGEGWILYNPESDLTIITPLGSIILYENSILITEMLRPTQVELNLVMGQATFNSYGVEGGTLRVSTPATTYTMDDEAEIFVITSDTEESVTTFFGSVESHNLITGATTQMLPFEKLHMQDMSRSAATIQSGYYLTYATFPSAASADQAQAQREQFIQRMSDDGDQLVLEEAIQITEDLVLVPSKPSVVHIWRAPQKPVVAPATPTVIIDETPSPPPPTFTDVQVHAVSVPVPLPPSSVVVQQYVVQPLVKQQVLTPSPPVFADIQSYLLPSFEEEEAPIPMTPSFSDIHSQLEEEEQIPVSEEEVVSETPRPSLSSSEEQSRQQGSVGVVAGYEFGLDGTDSNKLSHRLFAKPYFSKGPFAIRLNAAISTNDFSSYANTILPIPDTPVALTSYILSYFDHLRIGYETSAFYLILDNTRSMRSDLSTFFAPHFRASDRLIVQNKISIGPFSLLSSFDDLSLQGYQNGQSQWASTILEYTATGSYQFTLAVGVLVESTLDPNTADLFPLLSAKLPIINKRQTRLDALIQAQGYLPVYPNVAFDQFVDTTLTSFFPNYLIGGGLALHKGAFDAKLMATLNRGKNQNFLINDFAYNGMHSYSSDFDLIAEMGWQSKYLRSSFAWSFPFAWNFTPVRLSSDATQGADYSHFTLEFTIEEFSLGFGVQQLGVIDTFSGIFAGDLRALDLIAGPYASSFLTASYTYTPFTLSVKAQYPISAASLTTPLINVMASIDLNKRL